MTRVLLGPTEIAGQVALSAVAIRAAGGEATAYTPIHRFAYAAGPDVSPPVRVGADGSTHRRRWSPLRTSRLLLTHDVMHYHFGASYFGHGHLDARLMRRLGKTVVVQFHGSDVRQPRIEAARNPHYVAFEGESDERALNVLREWSEITGGHCLLADVGLEAHVKPSFPHVHRIPLALDTRRFAPRPPAARNPSPTVLHAPTERAGKGTQYVRRAVEELKARGVALTYREIYGLSQAETHAAAADCDIVIDQLCLGIYSLVSLEGMAHAKPVICYIEDALADRYPSDLPIVNANPLTITDRLAELLADGDRRAELGSRSRAFVEREHDVKVVGPKLLAIYDEIRSSRRSD